MKQDQQTKADWEDASMTQEETEKFFSREAAKERVEARSEALADRYGVLPASAFSTAFTWRSNWFLVEVEADAKGALVKFVVRREVDARRSLVLVILADGTVKTLWTNLNSDQHATLDSSKFSRP